MSEVSSLSVTVAWCPICEPDRDPSQERLLQEVFCLPHTPSQSGVDDAVAGGGPLPSGTSESSGETNRLFANFLHHQGRGFRGTIRIDDVTGQVTEEARFSSLYALQVEDERQRDIEVRLRRMGVQ